MANTYAEVYLHYVTAPKYREALISEDHRERAQRYLAATLQHRGHTPIEVYCRPDHIHVLFRLRTTDPISVLLDQLKTNSSREFKRWLHPEFSWQSGGGLFSVSRWDIEKIATYVRNQRIHHEKQDFLKEYKALLRKHGVEYDEAYLLVDPICLNHLAVVL